MYHGAARREGEAGCIMEERGGEGTTLQQRRISGAHLHDADGLGTQEGEGHHRLLHQHQHVQGIVVRAWREGGGGGAERVGWGTGWGRKGGELQQKKRTLELAPAGGGTPGHTAVQPRGCGGRSRVMQVSCRCAAGHTPPRPGCSQAVCKGREINRLTVGAGDEAVVVGVDHRGVEHAVHQQQACRRKQRAAPAVNAEAQSMQRRRSMQRRSRLGGGRGGAQAMAEGRRERRQRSEHNTGGTAAGRNAGRRAGGANKNRWQAHPAT